MRDRSEMRDQCVVARLPRRRPAAARTNAPVQIEPVRRASLETAISHRSRSRFDDVFMMPLNSPPAISNVSTGPVNVRNVSSALSSRPDDVRIISSWVLLMTLTEYGPRAFGCSDSYTSVALRKISAGPAMSRISASSGATITTCIDESYPSPRIGTVNDHVQL